MIKPADKGGAIVILDRDTYISEGNRQLSNTSFYRKASTDLTEEHNEKVNTNIEFLRRNGEITKSLESKLVTNNVKTPELYLLPKIHKNISPPPGRPVVSANKCPTEKISAFVDIFLRPHLPKIKSYLKDTTHLLQTLKELPLLKANAILCTLDVSSLYTNIPNKEGLKAVADFLSAHRVKGPNPEPTNSSLCKLLEMVLKMNNFNFDGNHYIQVSGTAMGTRVAPTFANIFMSDFEDKHVYSYHKQPLVWLRFIDDIFFIWEDGQESLDVFLKHLNQVHNSIKFTYETSRERVNFLDTWIQVNKEGKIDTDLYTKPTDSNNYLHYTSAHPTHNKKGIPYGQFLRLRRICSDEKSFVDHCIEKGRHFLRRGYPEDLIRTAFSKTLTKDRESLLKPKRDPEEETKNILVSTYNPGFKGLSSIVHRNWDLLGKSCATRQIHQTPITTAYRRPKNLREFLVRARLPLANRETKPNNTETPCNPCNTRNCRYCPKLNKNGRIKSKASGRDYTSRHNVTCKSSNLIYCISCKQCGMQYVGQTKNRLMDRFQPHFYNIGHNRPNSELARHFNQTDHHGLDDVEIHIVDFIHAHPQGQKSKYLRDLIEFKWIQRLHTNAPLGLNLMDPNSS